MRQNQKERLYDLAHNTAHHLEQLGHSLQHTLATAPEKVEQVKEVIGPALEQIQNSIGHFEKNFEKFEQRTHAGRENISEWTDAAQRKAHAVHDVLKAPAPTHETDHGGEKLLWLLVGLGAGALLGLLLAPASGRRSRALVRGQLEKNRRHLTHATSGHVADISNKARGLSHKIQHAVHGDHSGESVTDEILADRVRTRLGQTAGAGLPHLNVESCGGIVTLYGPMVNAAQELALITAVRQVEGVLEVQSKLPVSSENEEAQ